MAFDARLIVLNKQMDSMPGVQNQVLAAANAALNQFRIHVVGVIQPMEYWNFTSSTEINKYIRVPKKNLNEQRKDAETQYELLKVGQEKYTMERFASAKVAFVSISKMEKKTVIWFSFHSRLARVLPGFSAFTSNVAEALSILYQCEALVLHATSLSRHDDFFAFFMKGKVKNRMSGKAALTDVKDTYGVDINMCMNNIDQNLAIIYAPADYEEVKRDMADQRKRFENLKAEASAVEIKDKQDGTNMMEAFQHENDVIMAQLKERYGMVKRALQSDPIGGVLYFRIDDGVNIQDPVPLNEREFGRNVPPPAR